MDVLSFLFNTREGFAVLFFGGIVLFVVIAYVMERKTAKLYVDRGEKTDDEEDSIWDGLL